MSFSSFSSFPVFSSFPEPVPEAGPSKKAERSDIRKDDDRDDRDERKRKRRENKEREHRKHKEHGERREHKDDLKWRESKETDVRGKDRSRPSSTKPTTFDDDEREHRRRHAETFGPVQDKADSKPTFFVDRKGDPLNIQYGRPHSGDVPRYWLVGAGKKVLGLNRAYTVLYRSSRGLEIGVGNYRRTQTLTDSSSRKLLSVGPTRQLLASAADRYKYDEVGGFLRLPSGRGAQEQAYRSISNQRGDESDSSKEGSARSGDDSDDDDAPITLPAQQQKLKALEQELAAAPASVSGWLALLAHTLVATPPATRNARQARADIALAVLARALRAHPDNTRAVSLRLRYLRAGEEVWNESKLREEWEDALKAVGNPEIVLEWLDWRVRTAQKGIDGVVEDGVRSIDLMRGHEIGMLRAFWRVAVAMQQAGYVERATAMFQAQAELTFAIPPSLHGLPMATLLESLEEFWDAEQPRLGEEGARGWHAWSPSAPTTALSTKAVSPPEANATDLYERWSVAETWHDRHAQLPARDTDGDQAEADPYSTVLFSDIRSLLVPLSSLRAKDTFRRLWLTFLGLPLPGFVAALPDTDARHSSADERWGATRLTRPVVLSAVFPDAADASRRITSDAHAGVLVGREREYAGSALALPVREWAQNAFGTQEALGPPETPATSIWSAADIAAVDASFVRNVFAQCRLGRGDDEWDVMAVTFEAVRNIKSATKLSRSFLASARESIHLWASHARLERSRRKWDDARKVYETVLAPDSAMARDPGAGRLWWDWAEMEWFLGRADASRDIVLRAVGVASATGAGELRARRALEECIAAAADSRAALPWLKLRGLLELLAPGQGAPEAMLAVFDTHMPEDADGVSGEVHALAALGLLHHYSATLRHPSRPGLLRERAADAVRRFPDDTLVLALLLEAERGQGVWGRARAVLGEGALGPDGQPVEKSLARRVAEVWAAGWERGRWAAEEERIRAGLTAAVESERLRGSPILWRLFAEFEIRCGQLARAKKLLFRAVAECPLSKDLYLLAFGPLRSAFTPRELDGWAETMAERGIRMRTGLDEALQGFAPERSPESVIEEGMDYGEEDVERNADELRRLRPY